MDGRLGPSGSRDEQEMNTSRAGSSEGKGGDTGRPVRAAKMSDQQEVDAPTGRGPSSSSPSSHQPQHLNLNLQPNSLDDPSDPQTVLLPSFRDIRAKTLRALYGIQSGHHHPLRLFLDKSPKGSVDEAIRPLVDLINAHPSYATLSSCSGRIALFDPSATATCSTISANVGASVAAGTGNANGDVDNDDDAELAAERDNVASGKGSGRWALSSHGQIDPRQLIDILNEDIPGANADEEAHGDAPTLMFKHEPLLLHVAASTLIRAEKLLSLALALGFRESGIVSTSKRVTVAIRGVGLGLTVPLARRGALRPSDAYVEALVGEANQRFVANEDRLRRLYELVERELFVPMATAGGDQTDGNANTDSTETNAEEYEAIFEPLPKLGLWGHACAVVPTTQGCNVYAFGGHGIGPGGTKSAARSDKIYRLERKHNQWNIDNGWEAIDMNVGPIPSQFEAETINSIHMQHATLGGREGLAACVLPFPDNVPSSKDTSTFLVAVFGGRAGPAHPLDELLLYAPFLHGDVVWKPTDVRGEPPAARWGHTFTALSGRAGRMAIVCGGRSTREIVPTCHILNLVPMSDEFGSGAASHCHFLWETVKGEVSLFQHVSMRLSQQENDQNQETIFIFGGKDDPANLFTSGVLDVNGNATTPAPVLLTVDVESSNHSVTTLSHSVVEDDQLTRIGSSGCCIVDKYQSSSLLVISGGVPSTAGVKTSALILLRPKVEGCKQILESIPVKCRLVDDGASGKIDVGSLVRHSCIPLESDTPSILLAGGGISSFAFGPSYAESYRVSFHRICRNTPRGNTNKRGPPGTKAAAPTATSKASVPSDKESITDVVYVERPKAKELKNELEKAHLLDKSHRMVPADASSAPLDDASRYIAVPVSSDFAEMSSTAAVSFSWFSLVAGRGRQIMPFSTKVLGNRRPAR